MVRDAEPDVNELIAYWDIPTTVGGRFSLSVSPASVITVLGANGSGKSALATWMASSMPDNKLRRVLAQRRVWLKGSGPSISVGSREQYSSTLDHLDRRNDSRYSYEMEDHRSEIVLFDLLGAINMESARVSDLVYDKSGDRQAIIDEVGPRVLDRINSALTSAGFSVNIRLTNRQSFEAVNINSGNRYPIAQMSDGERNALMLLSDIISAPEDSLILLDEPERHLHRAVSAKLIESAVDLRRDCGYVVFTHDPEVARIPYMGSARTLIVSGIKWDEDRVVGWVINELSEPGALPNEVRTALLGGRDRVLFVEGGTNSIDLAVYREIFSDCTVTPVSSCEDVIRCIAGMRTSGDHHWVSAVGIVDGDARNSQERDSLAGGGIYVISVNEIENLLYTPAVLRESAEKYAGLKGEDATDLFEKSVAGAVAKLKESGVRERLCGDSARKIVGRRISAKIPTGIPEGNIEITVESPLAEILREFDKAVNGNDLDKLLSLVSIRNSGFRQAVASTFKVSNYQEYEKIAINSIKGSADLLGDLRSDVLSMFDQVEKGSTH